MSNYGIRDLIELIVSENAEGLSLHSGTPPVVHLRGEPHTVEGPTISPENAEELLHEVADTRQIRELRERGTIVFIFTWRTHVQFKLEASVRDDALKLDLRRLVA